MARVLVISEDVTLGGIIVTTLLSRGVTAYRLSLGSQAIRSVEQETPEVVVLQVPAGVVGRAYLAQFRLLEFGGRLVIVSAEEAESPAAGERHLRPWQLREILAAAAEGWPSP